MGSLVLAGASSGSTTITPTDAVTATVTLPSTGGTVQTSGSGYTANGVAYASSTSALTTGSVLNFDGNNLGLGVTPQTWSSSFKPVFQFGATGSLFNGSAYTMLSTNFYQDATSTDKYIASNYATNYYQNAGSHIWRTAGSGTAGNNITWATSMTLNSSGQLLINRTTDSSSAGGSLLQVTGTPATWVTYFENTNSTGSNCYGTLLKYINASPNNAGQSAFYFADSTTSRYQLYSNGGIANYSSNNVNLSDRREKTNFTPSKSYLDVICAIPVQTFNYIDQNLEDDDGLTLGVVAQDVQAIAPEFVHESNWGTEEEPKMRLSIYQTDLQYALMKSIQELSALVTAQSATITSLTERITALEGK